MVVPAPERFARDAATTFDPSPPSPTERSGHSCKLTSTPNGLLRALMLVDDPSCGQLCMSGQQLYVLMDVITTVAARSFFSILLFPWVVRLLLCGPPCRCGGGCSLSQCGQSTSSATHSNNRVQLCDGLTCLTVAGTDGIGSSGTQLNRPWRLAVTEAGEYVVADWSTMIASSCVQRTA